MNILDRIIQVKREEVERKKKMNPVQQLEMSPFFVRNCISLKEQLERTDKQGIIAEFKRKSPSKGMLNEKANIEKVSQGYIQAGASALSILTDEMFFAGSATDLCTARNIVSCPILRKDFIIDEYQLIESKSIGADAILLIASALPVLRIYQLAAYAKSLGLEILLELHSMEELDKITDNVDLIGINNRNLKDFSVDIGQSIQMAGKIPDSYTKIAESGIGDPKTVLAFKKCGFKGFLIGEKFMKEPEPEQACKNFILELERLIKIEKVANQC